MFILFGLGNNDAKYLKTKHNTGRIVLENLVKIWNLEMKKQKTFYFAKYQNTAKIIKKQSKTEQKLTKITKNLSKNLENNLNKSEEIKNLKSQFQTEFQAYSQHYSQINSQIQPQNKFQNEFKNELQKNPHNLQKNSQKEIDQSQSLTKDLEVETAILQEFYLVYSMGFMNNSGEVLQDFCSYYKLKKAQIIVLQDDSDQFIGNYKLTLGGGSAGHNGIISVYKHFDQSKIWRLKIGIRPPENRAKSETFVLSRLENVEEENLDKLTTKISQNLEFFQNFATLQNLINAS